MNDKEILEKIQGVAKIYQNNRDTLELAVELLDIAGHMRQVHRQYDTKSSDYMIALSEFKRLSDFAKFHLSNYDPNPLIL